MGCTWGFAHEIPSLSLLTIPDLWHRADNINMSKVRGSAVASGISGRMGEVVFIQSKFGTIARTLGQTRHAPTTAQSMARMRMARASAAFRAMTLEQAALWRDYAFRAALSEPRESDRPPLSAQQIFCALTTKLLQIDANAEIPMSPPESPLLGDSVQFTIARVPAGIQVTASQANAPDTITEILVQPLDSVHVRTYRERFRTALFTDFSSSLTATLSPKPTPACAIAVRFVRKSTGQVTGLVELGVV